MFVKKLMKAKCVQVCVFFCCAICISYYAYMDQIFKNTNQEMKRSARAKPLAKKKNARTVKQPVDWSIGSTHTMPNPYSEVLPPSPAVPAAPPMPPQSVPHHIPQISIDESEESDEDSLDGTMAAHLNTLLPSGMAQSISAPFVSKVKPFSYEENMEKQVV
ncbi:uncharacterized protein LOC128203027 isoform X2 [Mya arenaria]|uniref:uncharacterized protein LOC128203027 isoform X2 n=1 Tax=Mya arenaria TaxID=6604 RepID=UPI0022E64C66|nr:uncharacterized protein LOC128203027 isoform X2 [Mya arenaria]